MIASVEATVVYLVIAAVIGLVNWLANRRADQEQPPPAKRPDPAPSPTFPRPLQRSPPSEATPDEGVRRLMEALGLPTDQPPPRPPPRPSPAAPPPLPAQRERPPALPAKPRRVERRAPQPAALPSKPPPAAVPETVLRVPEPPEFPALQVDTLPEIRTLASTISASGRSAAGAPESDAYALSTEQPILRAASLREALRSPADVRRAIVLREVLGPPKGLPGLRYL